MFGKKKQQQMSNTELAFIASTEWRRAAQCFIGNDYNPSSDPEEFRSKVGMTVVATIMGTMERLGYVKLPQSIDKDPNFYQAMHVLRLVVANAEELAKDTLEDLKEAAISEAN